MNAVLTFYSLKNPEKSITFSTKYEAAKLSSVLIIIANQHILMISEGSCDTEDWSNDAENSALHHRNKLHSKIYSNRKTVLLNCYKISQYYCFTVFLIK